jgi:hypothetical protein
VSDSLVVISRPCPCCGSEVFERTRFHSTPRAEDVASELEPSQWSGFFKSKVFFTYGRCTSCGLLYCPRYFNDGSLSRLYGWMGDNTAGIPLNALQRTQAGYHALVRSRFHSGDYLEVGPDIGLFTDLISRAGTSRKLYLIEPNRAVWPALRQKCGGTAELILHESMLDVGSIEDGSIGLAVMIHVLDHLLLPRSYLDTVRKKLRRDGLLLIVTHNESSLLARLFGARFPIFCLQHPQLFNRHSMRRLLSSSGLAADRIVWTRNFFPAGYLLRHFLFQLGVRVSETGSLPWILGLPLGNIATIAGRVA